MVVALFGLAEIIHNAGLGEKRKAYTERVPLRALVPSLADLKASFWPMVRGSGLGVLIGILPGAGPAISSFMAYAMEKQIARDPSRFGKGAIEGLVAPEAANNADAQTAFIPTLTLGVPGDATTAIILAALIIHGITPGPKIITEAPELFWGLLASFWIGNLMLLVLNLPLIGLWVRLLRVPYPILFPCILLFSTIGVLSLNNEPFEVFLVAAFGVAGYVLPEAGVRTYAAAAGVDSRADGGGKFPPLAAIVARRPDDLPDQADQPGLPDRRNWPGVDGRHSRPSAQETSRYAGKTEPETCSADRRASIAKREETLCSKRP